MENTGRIQRGLTPSARRIIFGDTADVSIDAELETITRVDQAHLLMLSRTGLVSGARVAALLKTIAELRATGFAALRGKTAVRGVYLLYENHLISELGPDVGGVLQTGRSRNDLNATTGKLRLRAPWAALTRELLRLQAVLLARGRRFQDVVMPAYTHTQAAVPVTYGHYLTGLAHCLQRDVDALLSLRSTFAVCPLGAGAVGGTSMPIDAGLTAALLGFSLPAPHSMDAVASRDLALRLLSALAVYGVTLSRFATDFQEWSTAEFGFLDFPDELVGSSSMMPQKRNPFLLEHIQGRSASALGGFVRAATAMHATHFTNTIAVGTEGVAPVRGVLEDMRTATVLARLCVFGARPNAEAMLRSAERGFTTATELANRLVHAGVPFRSAHHQVGTLVREALAAGQGSLAAVVASEHGDALPAGARVGLDAASVAHASSFGGGSGATSREAGSQLLAQTWRAQLKLRHDIVAGWRTADAELSAAVAQHLRSFGEQT